MSGNTKELATFLFKILSERMTDTFLYNIDEFNMLRIDEFDGIIIGTYTWGNGEIPDEMQPLFDEFSKKDRTSIVTGIFGTGDRFYSQYCGAVDLFRDQLKTRTNLSVTLKVELLPQDQDYLKCIKFVELFIKRLNTD